MRPTQADMVSLALASIASIVAAEALESCADDPVIFEETIVTKSRKLFRQQLDIFGLVNVTTRPKAKRNGANERTPKPPDDSEKGNP